MLPGESSLGVTESQCKYGLIKRGRGGSTLAKRSYYRQMSTITADYLAQSGKVSRCWWRTYCQTTNREVRSLIGQRIREARKAKGLSQGELAYATLGNHTKAWECSYRAAYALYTAGHMDHAISTAVEATKNLTPCASDAEFLALTYYLMGCAYSAKGDVTAAQNCFRQAEMEAATDSDTVLRSLIAQSSCAFRQGDLSKALQTSQQAAKLATKFKRDHLKAEALIAVAVCLVKMGEADKVSGVLSRALSSPSLPTRTKCKAYREVIFALIDLQLVHLSEPFEDGLRLALADDNGTDNWERVKSLWALEKCRLHKDPKNAREEITRFANAFRDLMRYRDAADVLLFGAYIMKGQGRFAEAIELMESAVGYLRGQA